MSTGRKGSISAHHCPRRLNLNTVVVFSELSDRRNWLAVRLQYRQDLTVDAFLVSPSPFFF
jgi:hypothetical protein